MIRNGISEQVPNELLYHACSGPNTKSSEKKKYDSIQMVIIPRKSNDNIFALTETQMTFAKQSNRTDRLHREKTIRWRVRGKQREENLSMYKYHMNQRVQCLAFCQHYSTQQFAISSCPRKGKPLSSKCNKPETECSMTTTQCIDLSWCVTAVRDTMAFYAGKSSLMYGQQIEWVNANDPREDNEGGERVGMYQKHRCSIKE